MKYSPLNNNPNISSSRSESISPSLKMDSRGFPCISWIDKKNGINEVMYSFWDGLKWSYYDVPRVAFSNEDIIYSTNSLVLDENDSPLISFANKIETGFRLSLAKRNDGWVFSNYDVSYDVKWVGFVKFDRTFDQDFSSSSSSSSNSSSSKSSNSSESNSTNSSESSSTKIKSSSSTSSSSKSVSSKSISSKSESSSSSSRLYSESSSSSSRLYSESSSSSSLTSLSEQSASSYSRSHSSNSNSSLSSVSNDSPSSLSFSSRSTESSSSSSLYSRSSNSSISSNSSSSYSDSSLSSKSYSSSSDSSSSDSSSTDSSSSSYSSSSYSSSSSEDYTSSTEYQSSSSYDNVIYYYVVYDGTNNQIKVYFIDDNIWTLFGYFNANINDFEFLKIDICGKKIGISYVDGNSESTSNSSSSSSNSNNVIKYNFLDLFSASWSFSSSFQDLAYSSLYGEILDYSIVGDYKEDLSMLYFAWTSRSVNKSYINSAFAYDTGVEMPSDKVDDVIVESYDILVDAPSDYIVNGYKKIDICLNELSCPVIIAMGTSSRIFELEESGVIGIWNNEFIDIDAIGNGIVVNYLRIAFGDNAKISFSSDSGDIYYLEPSNDSSFPISNPNMVLLNDKWAYKSIFTDGQLNGLDIDGTYNNQVGIILDDKERPLLITNNQSTPITTTTTTTTLL